MASFNPDVTKTQSLQTASQPSKERVKPFKFGHVPRCATSPRRINASVDPLSPRSPTERKTHETFHAATGKKAHLRRAGTPGPGHRPGHRKISEKPNQSRDRSISLRSRKITRANSLTQPVTPPGSTHGRSNSAERSTRDLSPRKTHHRTPTEGTEGVPHLVLSESTVKRLRDFGQGSVGRALGEMILQEGERIAQEAVEADRQIAEKALSEKERAVERSAVYLILRDAEQQQYFLRRWPLFESFLDLEGQASPLTREQVLQGARQYSSRDIREFYTAVLQEYEVDAEKIPFTTPPDVFLWEALVSAAQVFKFLKERLHHDHEGLVESENPTDFLLKLCEEKDRLARIESLDLSRHPESEWCAPWFPLWFWVLELPNLDILNLKGHNCRLPENCLPKSKITFLDISDNPGFSDFPLDFWHLRRDLETLLFANTSVETLPEGINALNNLVTINGSYTGIRKFPKDFGLNWENIVEITFAGLELDEEFPFENFRDKENHLSVIDLRGSRVKGKPIAPPADWSGNITLILG